LRSYSVINWFSVILVFVLLACDNQEEIEVSSILVKGAGVYSFDSYTPLADKPINCFYYVPENSNSLSPIFMIIPGAGRDAEGMRDGLISKANERGFIVLALEFSTMYFPNSDVYNLANIFEDGDDPSSSTLNPEEEWTFSVLDPIFEDFKDFTGNITPSYDVFGHSAGAQMIHRYLIFQPEANFNRLVSSAAGWYAVPDPSVEFPYGIENSPAEFSSPEAYFARTAYIIVGQNDTDPNSFGLRHNEEADRQGLNRLLRAQFFFQESFEIASRGSSNFNWQYRTVANTGHDGTTLAIYAADFLY
jgi:hypothetical protein